MERTAPGCAVDAVLDQEKLCDNVKGWCLDGCIPGYKGNMCDDYDGRDDGGDNDDDRNNKDDDGNGGNEDDDCDDAVRRHVMTVTVGRWW